jgi:hypothetical protein
MKGALGSLCNYLPVLRLLTVDDVNSALAGPAL